MGEKPLSPCFLTQYRREDSFCEECTRICSKPYANWETNAKNKCPPFCPTTKMDTTSITTQPYTFGLRSTNTPSSTSGNNLGLILGITLPIVFIVIVIVIVIIIIKLNKTRKNWYKQRTWTLRKDINWTTNNHNESAIPLQRDRNRMIEEEMIERNDRNWPTNNQRNNLFGNNLINSSGDERQSLCVTFNNESEPTNPTPGDIHILDTPTSSIPTPDILTLKYDPTNPTPADIPILDTPTPSIPTADIPILDTTSSSIPTPDIPTLETDGLMTVSLDRSNDSKAGDIQLEPPTVGSSGDNAVMETDESDAGDIQLEPPTVGSSGDNAVMEIDESDTASIADTVPLMETAIAEEGIKFAFQESET